MISSKYLIRHNALMCGSPSSGFFTSIEVVGSNVSETSNLHIRKREKNDLMF